MKRLREHSGLLYIRSTRATLLVAPSQLGEPEGVMQNTVMANRHNQKRTRESLEPLYDRPLQRVLWK